MKKGSKSHYLINECFENDDGRKYEIIGYCKNVRRRLIRFESGYEDEVLISQIKHGKIKDLYQKTYYGIACLGIKGGTNHLLYWRWFNMISRCYNPKHSQYKFYGAKDVIVSDELLNFKTYIEVVSNLEEYDNLILYPDKYDVDKDIKSGKIYGKDTIKIIPKTLNASIAHKNDRVAVDMIYNNNVINSFASITEAEKITNIHSASISRAVKTGIKAGGYNWRKVD